MAFRSFNLEKDIELIHSWINMDYTQKFWRLPYSLEELHKLYYSIQRNSNGHSYLGLLDDQPVCQFDLYRVLADEISVHIPDAGANDCGFHLLMAPNKNPLKGLSVAIVTAFLDHYFSFPDAGTMYAEPDMENERSNQLLQRAGFRFSHQVKMSYKNANLWYLTKPLYNEQKTIL